MMTNEIKNKEEKMRFAIEFAKQAREHLEALVNIEADSELNAILNKAIKDIESIRRTLRRAKTSYTAAAEEAEYVDEGLGVDSLTLKIMAEKRAKALLEKIEAETRS